MEENVQSVALSAKIPIIEVVQVVQIHQYVHVQGHGGLIDGYRLAVSCHIPKADGGRG
jgi:hypothetical protein